jgi:hypothetical protein
MYSYWYKGRRALWLSFIPGYTPFLLPFAPLPAALVDLVGSLRVPPESSSVPRRRRGRPRRLFEPCCELRALECWIVTL